MQSEHGFQAVKKRGLRVVRAVITKSSTLIGKKAKDVDFYQAYKAAVVAVLQDGKNAALSSVDFKAGDILVLQADEDSLLLQKPPPEFYQELSDAKENDKSTASPSITSSFVNRFTSSRNVVSQETKQPDKDLTSTDLEVAVVANERDSEVVLKESTNRILDQTEVLENLQENVRKKMTGTEYFRL